MMACPVASVAATSITSKSSMNGTRSLSTQLYQPHHSHNPPPPPSNNNNNNNPCKCCPYGFHIDTDFVRYCDALLTALYGTTTRGVANTTSSCRSFGSLRRKLHYTLSTTTTGDGDDIVHSHSFSSFSSPPPTKSFLSYCDLNSNNINTTSTNCNKNQNTNNRYNHSPNNKSTTIHTAINGGYHRSLSHPVSGSSGNDTHLLYDSCTTQNTFHPHPHHHRHYQASQTVVNGGIGGNGNGNGNNNNNWTNYNSSKSINVGDSFLYRDTELTDVVNKFEETYLDSKTKNHCSSVVVNDDNNNGATVGDSYDSHDSSSPPPSPAPSSSCLSSTLSKSVLAQIRNHLALSITRVKQLEEQVTLIPSLQQQIEQLTLQRDELQGKLNKCNVELVHKSTNTNDATTILSLVTCESISLVDNTSSSSNGTNINNHQSRLGTRSIGTLTSFAPVMPPKNASTQTDSLNNNDNDNGPLKSPKMRTFYDEKPKQQQQSYKSEHHSICCQTDEISYCHISTSTDDTLQCTILPCDDYRIELKDSAVQVSLELITPVEKQQTLDHSLKTYSEKQVSTEDLCTSSVPVLRPHSLDINDSLYDSTHNTKSTVSSTNFHCTTPSSSTHSIRLCDKCHEMVNMVTPDQLSCTPEITALLLPKIIKSDSGISVERSRVQVDGKCMEDSGGSVSGGDGGAGSGASGVDVIERDMSSSDNSTQLSDEPDGGNGCAMDEEEDSERKSKKPLLDYSSLLPSKEFKTALKFINEHLLNPRKSAGFYFPKNVSFVKRIWFQISSNDSSDSRVVEAYLDCFEKYSAKMLDFMVNLGDSCGNTAMHYAISYANFDIVSVLLDSKVCDVNKYNKAGYTATMLVSLVKLENTIYRDVVERLFHQADVNMKAKQNGQTALMLAASHGRMDVCKILLQCGAEINLQDNDGSTALMCAAEHGHTEVCALLLSHPECDPLMEDNEGSTALKIALVNGHNEVGILLYTGTRVTNYGTIPGTCYSSLGRLPHHSPKYSPAHLRRTGSFSYNPGHHQQNSQQHNYQHNVTTNNNTTSSNSISTLSLRNSPPRNRHSYSVSTPSSPS